MAKYIVTRACGHEETIALFGPHRDREWRLEKVEPNKLCYECWQAEVARQREEANREAAEAAKELGLPELVGTEKQVAWASTIRKEKLDGIERHFAQTVRMGDVISARLQAAAHRIRQKTEASYWIDRRNSHYIYLLERECDAIEKECKQPAQEIIIDAQAEATIRPENPVTETVAEIRVLTDAVEITFPEKREAFREIAKGQLKMEWAGSFWRRKLIERNGTPQDRAAEAGHRLLAAGFIVRIYDERVRAKAISGQYEPECTRWILRRDDDRPYGGWLVISWDRQRDDFYGAAKRIRGSRWSRPSIVVPPENYEEVLDFAERYGFKVSAKAQGVIDTARRVRGAALVVNVETPPEAEAIVATGKPPVLDIPENVGIADEFRD